MLVRLLACCVARAAIPSLPIARAAAQKPPALPELLKVTADAVVQYA